MKPAIRQRIEAFVQLLRSPRGKSIVTFTVFLGISAILWLVLSLNETVQRDLRCPIRLVNVPDSLTRVTPLPEAINVSVKSRAASVLSYAWNGAPTINIDYRNYHSRGTVEVSASSLRGMVRSIVGQGCEVVSMTPDSVLVRFTNSPGVLMPVKIEAEIETAPQYTLAGLPKASVDSVRVYSVKGIPRGTSTIPTKNIVIENLGHNTTIRVPLIAPQDCRVIPDSIDVTITVDPLVSKSVTVPIKAVGVPAGERLIIMPSQITVNYMLPMSTYKTRRGEPDFVVEAHYSDLSPQSDKLPVRLVKAPNYLTNAFINTDSVMYLIERTQ